VELRVILQAFYFVKSNNYQLIPDLEYCLGLKQILTWIAAILSNAKGIAEHRKAETPMDYPADLCGCDLRVHLLDSGLSKWSWAVHLLCYSIFVEASTNAEQELSLGA